MILFTIGDTDKQYGGWATGSTWNGFDNVVVTPLVRDAIASDFEKAFPEEIDTPADLRSIPENEEGLIDLSGGFATVIVETAPRR